MPKVRSVLVNPDTGEMMGEVREGDVILRKNSIAYLDSCRVWKYEDCCLKHDNGDELTTNDLIEISGFSRAETFRVISSLVKKDILYKGRNSSKNRQYFINPWIFCKGNRINKVLKTMFKNYKIRVLGGTQWKNIKD